MIPALMLLSQLVQLAPGIAKIFGGGEATQEIAETAAKVAKSVTGTTTNDDALAALQANPDKLIEFQKMLEDAAATQFAAEVADKGNARARDVEFLKAGTRNYRADFLVFITVVIILAIMAVVINTPTLSEFAKGSLTTILGVFLNQLTNVFSFEFGTTKTGKETQEKITAEYIKS